MGRKYTTSGCGVFVAAACLLAGAGESGAEDAKLIYRTYDTSGNYWVTFVCDMDGKNVAKLALALPKRFENKFFDPVRSPDGKKVAFYGTPNKGGGFFVADADGTNAKRLTDDDEHYYEDLCWFPDGKRLVYYGGEGRLWVVNADGTAPAALTKEKTVCNCPSVSPDGKQIALITGENKRRAVAVVNADGSKLKTVRNLGKRFVGTVAWSPDGKRLLFNDGELYAMNPDGSDVKQLTTKLGGVNDLAWSPDGKFILFSRYQTGAATPEVGDEKTNFKSDVYVANADGSNAKIAVKGLDNGRPRWWTP